MDEQQPNDQTGFRPNTGIDDAFVVLECFSSKSLEWNAPIWFAGSGLTKAVNRIEYTPFFDALLQQVSHTVIALCCENLEGTDWLSSGAKASTLNAG